MSPLDRWGWGRLTVHCSWLLLNIAAHCQCTAPGPVMLAERVLVIEHGELKAVFRDNSQSPKVLSGLDSLFNTKDAPDFDAWDPEGRGSSAGLNFEHIISGHRNPNNSFTPRSGPYALHRLPGGRSVQLVRRAEDSPWRVASTLTYTLAKPNFVDLDFRCTPRDAGLFGERGWAIFFFASYMNDVTDVAINFRGLTKPDSREQWIAGDAPAGHADWNMGGTYRHVDAPDLEYDADLDFRLNNWSYDWPRYTKPFCFGRAAHGMTLILMFDRAYAAEDEIRLSLFKFKVPRRPRPAWDFQYVIHKVETGKEYGFKGRLVWKRFIDQADCLHEYETWVAEQRR